MAIQMELYELKNLCMEFEKTTIAMDERGKSMMQKAFDLIFRADAGYKVPGYTR